MKAVLKSLYTEPVVFLALVSAIVTALATEGVFTGWIAVATIAAVTALQRSVVSPSAAVKTLKRKVSR